MATNGKDAKHTRPIAIKIYFARNGEELFLHKTLWCKEGVQL